MPHYKFNCSKCGKETQTYRVPSHPIPKQCRECSPGRTRKIPLELEQLLQEAYMLQPTAKEALDQCESDSRFNKASRSKLKRWAICLGLTKVKQIERKWKPEDLKVLEGFIGQHPEKIHKLFKIRGIKYSTGSIAQQIRRMGYSTRPDGFTPEELGEVLGCHRMTVQRWVQQGKIKVTRYDGGNGKTSGSKQWISPGEVAKFLRAYPELISGRVLDFPLVISLLDEFLPGRRK